MDANADKNSDSIPDFIQKYDDSVQYPRLAGIQRLTPAGISGPCPARMVFPSRILAIPAHPEGKVTAIPHTISGRKKLRKSPKIVSLSEEKSKNMLVRAKKSLGQHFLTDLSVARRIAETLEPEGATPEAPADVLEIGPGMGVLSQYLMERNDISLKMVEIDRESVDYLLVNFPKANGALIEADFLKLKLENFFKGDFCIIGNFPYNISSQIFFKILDHKDNIPQVVCMIQKEVAERIAEKPGSKVYGILSVLLQAWYDIEYMLTVGEGAFNPPPKVKSAVIRLKRNGRKSLGCDENLFKAVVKTGFNQRRKTLRNSLKTMIAAKAEKEGWDSTAMTAFASDPVFDLRPERLGVEDFISLTSKLA